MTEDQFERLAQLIKGVHDDLSVEMNARFEKVDARFDQVDTRFEKIDGELAYIRAELRDIRHDLEMPKEKTADHAGYSKEINHAFTRIAAIEKHLEIPSTA